VSDQGQQSRAEAGRDAMLRMVAGFDAVGRTNTQLVVVNTELTQAIQVLIQHNAALLEHLASLQQQVGALTVQVNTLAQVEARRVGVPVVAPEAPLDPLGQLGRTVVDGFMGLGGQPAAPRRRRNG
jgi:hypothetical protein